MSYGDLEFGLDDFDVSLAIIDDDNDGNGNDEIEWMQESQDPWADTSYPSEDDSNSSDTAETTSTGTSNLPMVNPVDPLPLHLLFSGGMSGRQPVLLLQTRRMP